jgi:hypothetical protein
LGRYSILLITFGSSLFFRIREPPSPSFCPTINRNHKNASSSYPFHWDLKEPPGIWFCGLSQNFREPTTVAYQNHFFWVFTTTMVMNPFKELPW